MEVSLVRLSISTNKRVIYMFNEEDWFDVEPKGIWVCFGEGICVEDARPLMSKDGF